ncbi:hypothetical protein HYT60_01085 [Candidatus Woesebacteria bacterium]|nr:hypothetical protein [Candidatus Woesebacteria bacterium]
MKKEIFVHFAFFVSLFIFISIARGYLSFSSWPFWLGGLVGTSLPDIDHLLYVFFLKPQELTSQRVSYLVGKRDIWGSLELLAETRSERSKLIFHTATFQLIFIILTFFVLTSSGSLFGRGLVLAFFLHLIIDQAVDLAATGGLSNWFKNFPLELDARKQKTYWWLQVVLLLIFSFFL